MGLPRQLRMTGTGHYAKVRQEGKSRAGRLLIMAVLPGAEGGTKFGFTVTKKIGNAVVRNRVKRRLREIARVHEPEVLANAWIVSIPRHPAVGAEFFALEKEWLYLARKLGVLKPEPITP